MSNAWTVDSNKGHTYSFFRRAGRVGTNFIFWVPALVVSGGIFARLAIAFPGFDGPGAPDMVLLRCGQSLSLDVRWGLAHLEGMCHVTPYL